MPVQEVQRKTTSWEFLLWQAWFMDNPDPAVRIEHYLAQIIADLRNKNLWAKPTKRWALKDCLMKFVTKMVTPEEPKKPEMFSTVEEARQSAAEKSKSVWFSLLGIKK